MPAESNSFGKQISMWNQEEIAEYYGRYASKYDKEIDEDQSMYPGPFVIGRWVVEWLLEHSAEKQQSILDLGCGTGQSGMAFLRHQRAEDCPFEYVLYGLDTTPEVCYLRQLTVDARQGGEARFRAVDKTRLGVLSLSR